MDGSRYRKRGGGQLLMAIKFVDETDLSTVGNAIRGKTGGSGLLTFPDGMAAAIAGIQAGGGDDDSLKTVIERTAVNPTLPGDLVKIGDSAFYNCGNLALTSLPDGITSIGDSAFYNCGNLALTSLPDGITRIGGSAFGRCTGLITLTFEGTPTSIDGTAFIACTNIATINVPWAEGAVANAPWGADNATIHYNYTGD